MPPFTGNLNILHGIATIHDLLSSLMILFYSLFLRGHNYPIYSVDVSAWSIYLATASHDRTARLWSLDRTFCLRIFAGHQQEVNVSLL